MLKKMPTKRFGRTEVQIPVLSCGGMRFQQSWEDIDPKEIEKSNQQNVEATIHAALSHGINHIETARGYGTSEYQLGKILPSLPRDEMYVQTKVVPFGKDRSFLDIFNESMSKLNLDYVDFLSLHGLNTAEHLEETFKKGGMLDQMRAIQKEGRARFLGFSTHGDPRVVVPACERGEFDYVNLHWYYIYHPITWPSVEMATKNDMGLFIISPNDKGGKLYEPTDKMKSLCDPLTPMQWHDLYCLSKPEVHTLSLGAAKPSDFDEHVYAVKKYWDQKESLASDIERKIEKAMIAAVGEEWWHHWHEGLPHFSETPDEINVMEVLRLWTFYKGLDLLDFAKMRYNLLGNADHWFPGKTAATSVKHHWDCLEKSSFKNELPAILEEAHQLFFDEPKKRLSES